MVRRHSRHETERPFVGLPLSLVGGVALRALSIAARRLLDRLIAEHLKHGGKENGLLRVSYRQLSDWTGAHQENIPPALSELVCLGLIVIERGVAIAGQVKRPPNSYRLTFLPDHEGGAPTDEWRRWEPSKGADEAGWKAAAARARSGAEGARGRRLRSDDDDAAVEKADALLKRLGKSKIGRPGNKQTRAALNRVNSHPLAISHPPRTGAEPPPAEGGGNAVFHPPRTGVDAHPPQTGAPSTSMGSMGRSRAKLKRGAEGPTQHPLAEAKPRR